MKDKDTNLINNYMKDKDTEALISLYESTTRQYIDWDENYDKTFRIVKTPEDAQSGGEWTPDLVSVVTPENGKAWTDWNKIDPEALVKWKHNWNEIQKGLGQHKYDQIIRSRKKTQDIGYF